MPEKNLTIGIAVPVYNNWHLAQRNVQNCLLWDGDRISQIVLVDDCSPEANPFVFPENVRILRNTENLGYTRTANRALQALDTDLIVLLDSDAHPVRPFADDLCRYFSENQNLGLLGLCTLDEAGLDSGNYGYEPQAWELVAGQRLSGTLAFLKNKKYRIPYSCAVVYRKKCLDEIGPYDEHFQFLDADVDHAMRIHRSRWLCEYAPDVAVFHVGGGSIGADSRRVLMYYDSRWKLLKKHGKIAWPAMLRALVLARIFLELTLLRTAGRFLFKDPAVLADKVVGRKKLLAFCAKNYH
ncbi:MAG: glycosyltransferase family 2 protein [Saprospiraceae bacterium]